jgi:hypothetical protein
MPGVSGDEDQVRTADVVAALSLTWVPQLTCDLVHDR